MIIVFISSRNYSILKYLYERCLGFNKESEEYKEIMLFPSLFPKSYREIVNRWY